MCSLIFTLGMSYLSRICPSSAGGKGRGGRVDVLWRAVCRSGLYVESGAGDFAWDVTEKMGSWVSGSCWGGGGGGGTLAAGLGATGGEGWGGAKGIEGEDGAPPGAAVWSSQQGGSSGCGGGGGVSATAPPESLSRCGASVLAERTDELTGLWTDEGGEVPPLARAAASAARRSFFLRLSSAPRLEFRGSREGGERLAGRLLWELPPPRPEEVCLLLRDREEERREEE